ncbi:LacI family DNA-binding transcriptional regulator [Paludibacterium paludis]|uniref:Sucrose operon repressor n=1 Tax=Paludibacterium paludis TaxID=1225769 RepID=A0A918P3J6_9NEIS|nr:LacI family DNA-binding transcriptional regulator [Paludibacterium paludis]GGY18368.1 sucrose operon repressor [Paludibacterium paludis]
MTAFKRLTIDDIARLAQVSRTTASMVLNGHAERYRISRATVERVERIAREQHFNPSQSARSLRSRRSNSIGLVIPDLTNSAHAALAQSMESLCRECDHQLVLVTSDEDPVRETEGMAHLVSRQVDGMVVVPCSGDAGQYQPWLKRLPLVFADRRIDAQPVPSAVTDATGIVAELIGEKLASGVSEVVFFGGQPDLSASGDRLAGYRQALAAHGIAERGDWVFQHDFQRESGYAMMKNWYQSHGRYPEALFTASITLLEGALAFISDTHALREAPGCLMTFDDHPLLDCLPLRIDAIVQDSMALARASLDQVFALLAGIELGDGAVRVPASLHRRQ